MGSRGKRLEIEFGGETIDAKGGDETGGKRGKEGDVDVTEEEDGGIGDHQRNFQPTGRGRCWWCNGDACTIVYV